MEDFPARFADLLESVATKARALTVDRAARVITMAALALPVAVLAVLGIVYLFLTIHGALAIPLGSAGASGVMGGLFVVAGALLWRKRIADLEDRT